MSSRRLNLLADWYGELTDYTLPVYGQNSAYKDNVRVASVNFHPVWGDVDANVAKIKELMQKAHEDGVELLVFPEMALTAYSVVLPEAVSYTHLIIMLAHRLKTVRNADQILVFDNAPIVQRGTHAELIQQKGLYADFVSARQEAIGWKLAQ